MMDDDAWKSYTDEKIERLEKELEYVKRARFLRSQGFTFARIAEHLNEQGLKNRQGRSATTSGAYQIASDVEMGQGHDNGGRRWSDETRRRHDEARAEWYRRYYGHTEWYRRHYGDGS